MNVKLVQVKADEKDILYRLLQFALYDGSFYINNEFNQTGKTIAEFLIIPNFRRHHIGKKAAILSFEQYPGNWEVQPMENNPGAYNFWEKSYI